ncbi:MAG: hypothetical protein R2748_16385 [Bryobacterales bacterium]
MQYDDGGALTTSVADLLTLYIEGTSLLEESIAFVAHSGSLLESADLALDQALLPNLREGVRWTRRLLALTSGDVKVLGVTHESDAFMEQLDVRLQTRSLSMADLQRVKTLMLRDVPRLRQPSRIPLALSSLGSAEWKAFSRLDQAVVTAIPNTFLLPTAILTMLWRVAPERLETLARNPKDGMPVMLQKQRLGSLQTRIDRHLEALKIAGIQVVVRPHADKRAKKDLFLHREEMCWVFSCPSRSEKPMLTIAGPPEG